MTQRLRLSFGLRVSAFVFAAAVLALGLRGRGLVGQSPPATAASQPARTINVLYVETSPRWEFRHVRDELIRDQTINMSTLLLNVEPDFEQSADPKVVDAQGNITFPGPLQKFPDTAEELARFDVLLIGDVSPKEFTPAQQKLIVDFVEKSGRGLGWIAGQKHTPDSYAATDLEPLFPVTAIKPAAQDPAPATVPNEPYTLKLTDDCKKSPLFAFQGLDKNNLEEFAPMYWYKPVTAKPDAKVLAVLAKQTTDGKPAPIIVTAARGKGRIFFSAIADTWRWRRDGGEKTFCSYWLETCRFLVKQNPQNRTRSVSEGPTPTLLQNGAQTSPLPPPIAPIKIPRILSLFAEIHPPRRQQYYGTILPPGRRKI